jgi:hypothetical protein
MHGSEPPAPPAPPEPPVDADVDEVVELAELGLEVVVVVVSSSSPHDHTNKRATKEAPSVRVMTSTSYQKGVSVDQIGRARSRHASA